MKRLDLLMVFVLLMLGNSYASQTPAQPLAATNVTMTARITNPPVSLIRTSRSDKTLVCGGVYVVLQETMLACWRLPFEPYYAKAVDNTLTIANSARTIVASVTKGR